MRGSNPTTGEASFMSSAMPCGRPSTMSIRTTSASPRSTIRIAVVCPTNPLPTTVTRMGDPLLVRWVAAPSYPGALADPPDVSAVEPTDHRVGERRRRRPAERPLVASGDVRRGLRDGTLDRVMDARRDLALADVFD